MLLVVEYVKPLRADIRLGKGVYYGAIHETATARFQRGRRESTKRSSSGVLTPLISVSSNGGGHLPLAE